MLVSLYGVFRAHPATKTRTHAQLDDRAKAAEGLFGVDSTKARDPLAQVNTGQFQAKRERCKRRCVTECGGIPPVVQHTSLTDV